MKFCRDCKWAERTGFFGRQLAYMPDCQNPATRRRPLVDLVTGESRTFFRLCESVRIDPDSCGLDARYFEPRS